MTVIMLQDYLRSGGTERQTVFLARELSNAGHRVQVLTFRPGGVFSTDLETIDHRALQVFDIGLDWLALGLSRAIRNSAPDIIVCMGRVANSYAGILKAKFPKIKVVSTVRTGKTLPFLYRRSLGSTSHIIVNTYWWKDELLHQGVNADKISVVHNPVTMSCTQKERELLRKEIRWQFSVASETCVFICVQMFRAGKRHERLIHYFSEIGKEGNWQLWLIGDGKERKKCERMVGQLGLDEQIQFMGFVKDPLTFYAGADVAISVSQEDSLPNFLIEAQSTGLPVIAGDYRGVREAMVPELTGFLISLDKPKDFVKAVHTLAMEKNLRKRMSAAARIHAQEKFSPGKQGSRTIDILQSLVRRMKN